MNNSIRSNVTVVAQSFSGGQPSNLTAGGHSRHLDNPNQRLVLNEFGGLGTRGNASQPMTADVAAMTALLQRAKVYAYGQGARDVSVADEAVSQAMTEIATSALVLIFQVGQPGLRAYVNRILWRKVRDAIRKRMEPRRLPLVEEIKSASSGPAEAAALAEIGRKVLGTARKSEPKPEPTKVISVGRSTAGVHKHRARKMKWEQVRHLFPDVPFRPVRRFGN